MSTPKKVFWWIFGLSLLLGLAIGLGNLVAPGAVSVSWNGANVEGIGGVPVALFAGGLPGLFFGLMGAGIAAIFSRKKS